MFLGPLQRLKVIVALLIICLFLQNEMNKLNFGRIFDKQLAAVIDSYKETKKYSKLRFTSKINYGRFSLRVEIFPRKGQPQT